MCILEVFMFVDGKAVVITGATRGIGFETAKKFHTKCESIFITC